jgi:hypothetical protein
MRSYENGLFGFTRTLTKSTAWDLSVKAHEKAATKKAALMAISANTYVTWLKIFYRLGLVFLCMVCVHQLFHSCITGRFCEDNLRIFQTTKGENMKTIIIISLFAIAGMLASCGSSEMDCVEQCSISFGKTNNKCRLDHPADNTASSECSNQAFRESHVCQGKCYGQI